MCVPQRVGKIGQRVAESASYRTRAGGEPPAQSGGRKALHGIYAVPAQAVTCLRELEAWSRAQHAEIECTMEGRRETRPPSRFVFPAGSRARSRVLVDEPGTSRRRITAGICRRCSTMRVNGSQSGPASDYNPHDLRRTAGTTMAELGVSRFIIERVLNHTDRTVTSIYDRYSYSKKARSRAKTRGVRGSDGKASTFSTCGLGHATRLYNGWQQYDGRY